MAAQTVHDPLVSVIIIFLDGERFIEEAIESVIGQEYEDWELFLVDDGSSDRSTGIARRYEEQYGDRITYLEHPGHQNLGMSTSRNLGLRHSSGQYVAFLDADDFWVPEKLLEQVELLEAAPEAGMLCGALLHWHSWSSSRVNDEVRVVGSVPGERVSPLVSKPEGNLISPPSLFGQLYPIGEGVSPGMSGVLFRRELIDRVGGLEERFPSFYEDQALFLKCYLVSTTYLVDRPWHRYRQHYDSCVHSTYRSSRYHAQRKQFLIWLEGYLRENGWVDTDVWRSFQNTWAFYRHPILFRVAWYVRNPAGFFKAGFDWLAWRLLPPALHRRIFAGPRPAGETSVLVDAERKDEVGTGSASVSGTQPRAHAPRGAESSRTADSATRDAPPAARTSRHPDGTRYALAVFLGSLLLFQVQPVMGKCILPWFGGGPAVWTTCMLFFQVALLAGYAYAHLLTTCFSIRRQAVLHVGLLVLSMAVLPIAPHESWKPGDGSAPTGDILLLLAATVGIPFVLVSSTGPLLQRWFSLEHPGRTPYRLYSLSNVGALLGVLTYPFIVEPNIGLRVQTLVWSIAYGAFVVASGWCALGLQRLNPVGRAARHDKQAGSRPSARRALLWLALSAAASLLLLASTNQVCQNIAPVPLLWIIPLALYLSTFILCFESERWYDRRIFGPALLLLVAATGIVLHQGSFTSIIVQAGVHYAALFVGCMVCHGELARLKPHPRSLTAFYLIIALGGATGGLLAALVAPTIFASFWEYHLTLLVVWLLFCVRWNGRWRVPCSIGGAAVLVCILGFDVWQERAGAIAQERNFYGVLAVREESAHSEGWRRVLTNGRINHGCQLLEDGRAGQATTYYGPNSGIGVAIEYFQRTPREELHIGMIGLGVGTILAYGREEDRFRFYEINPDVLSFSSRYFTYREDAVSKVEIVLGDARNSLQREWERDDTQDFEILGLDAFTGDAIPTHLLTREAFHLYSRHLSPQGVLAFHISSDHVDLRTVLRRLAQNAHFKAVRIVNHDDARVGIKWSDWVLVTRNEEFLADPSVRSRVQPWSRDVPDDEVWTDDFHSLFETLSW